MSIRKWVFDAVERTYRVKLVPRGMSGPLLERDHLERFFEAFRVDCVFDVGANEGQYAEMLRAIGYRGSIVSFEPIPAAASVVRQKARTDGNWFIEAVPLDDAERPVTFNIMKSSQFSSLKTPSHAQTRRFEDDNVVIASIDAVSHRLDRYVASYRDRLGFERPFLKMDTQGNDLAVARGAGDELRAFVGLQSELAIQKIYEDVSDMSTTLAYYKSAGFELSAFVPNNFGHFPVLVEIDCIMFNRAVAERLGLAP